MLTAFIGALRTADLRKKLLFSLFIIAVFRLGQQLPTPGVSEEGCPRLRQCRVEHRRVPDAEPVQRRLVSPS